MGILDEAIREHLELKRQHGVDDSELKQLEDEAFGPPERPGAEPSDALAEAPTEFMTMPDTGEEEQPAVEHEAVEPEPEAVQPDQEREDREAIAEQPTEHFDVEEEFAASAKAAPSDEELVEQEMDEPRLAPVDPLADPELDQPGEVEVARAQPAEEDEDEDFWDDRRLSEELDQALEAPVTEPREPVQAEEPAPAEEPAAPEPIRAEERHEQEHGEDAEASQSRSDSDLLEDTPEFLEDAPEDDQLWFEQKPPKDFDFDD